MTMVGSQIVHNQRVLIAFFFNGEYFEHHERHPQFDLV